MAKHVARYIVTNGLAGCYMPDCHHGAIEFTTRKATKLSLRALAIARGEVTP